MTDRHAELDAALERVIAAARDHLTAVKAADGRTDDDEVWRAYVELNNASYEYDEMLLDAFGEVTPWDVEASQKAGLETVTVVTGGFSEQELRDAGAVAVFDSLTELRRHLDEPPFV